MTNHSSHVLVALNSLRLRRRALEIGAHLATRQNLPLTAVFIENIELRYASELPFVQEIDRLSGALTTFEPPRLEQLYRQQINQVQRWLAEIQRQLPLAGNLQIVQGSYTESVLSIAGERDFVVFSTIHEWTIIQHKPPVWVWLDNAANAEKTLALAEEFARSENIPLFIAAPQTPKSVTLPEKQPVLVLIEPEGFIKLLNKQGCSAVFCARSSPLANRLPLEAPCPVLLI